MLRRRVLVSSLVITGGLLAAACGEETAYEPKRPVAPEPVEPTPIQTGTTVRVAVPNDHNLQWMSFWTALGAGYFQDQGLAVDLVFPGRPTDTPELLLSGAAEVALLPPPLYLSLIRRGSPIFVFANLLRNESINLIIRRDIMESRGLSEAMHLADRLKGIKGLKVGVALNASRRIYRLFQAAGLDADQEIEVVMVAGQDQNAAFGKKQVDALFAHTPYLETALLEQDAVMLVNQSNGEWPELAFPQIHCLATTQEYARANETAVLGLTRGVYRAQLLLRMDLKTAADALFKSGVTDLERAKVEKILAIYQPAIPETPAVSVDGVRQATWFGPRQSGSSGSGGGDGSGGGGGGGQGGGNSTSGASDGVDLSNINISDFLAPQFAQQVVAGS